MLPCPFNIRWRHIFLLGSHPVLFIFSLGVSKWTLLRHVQKQQHGTERDTNQQQRNEFEKWNHVIFFFLLFLNKNKRKVLCCYREYNRQPEKKNFFGDIIVSLSYIFDWAPFSTPCAVNVCISMPSNQRKKKKEIPFKIVIVITVESAQLFFFSQSPITSIDPKGKPTTTTTTNIIEKKKSVWFVYISRVLTTTSWAWHGRQNLFFSILFGCCLTCFLSVAPSL